MRAIKTVIFSVVMIGTGVAATFFYLHGREAGHDYEDMHRRHHGTASMQHSHHASSQHQHDEVNMPGLQGKDTTEKEVADLKKIFISHQGIEREVVNTPDGIITTTQAADPDLREAIISHVSMMVTRLQEGKNPEVFIQSPTLDRLFEVYDHIETEIEMTDLGVTVIQTSSNPDVVKFLQTHAAEVSDMSARGMAAVHERMMKQKH